MDSDRWSEVDEYVADLLAPHDEALIAAAQAALAAPDRIVTLDVSVHAAA